MLMQIDWKPVPRTLRTFGLICLVAFPALGAMAYYRVAIFALLPDAAARPTAIALAVVGLLAGAIAFVAPAALRPLYVGMSLVGAPIGFAVSITLFSLLYFLVLTPIAIVFRVIGRDALKRTPDRSSTSYWTPRAQPKSAERYFRQF